MSMTNQYVRMHRLFRRLQQKNRFVGRVTHSGLTPAETHFIIELQALPERGISELASLLGLNQSSCSRIAQSLSERGYIKISPMPQDTRRKRLTITDKGRKTISLIDQVSQETVSGYRRRISPDDFELLVEGLTLIADGYNHPKGIRRPHELEYRVQQRRVTRCFGLLGDHVFGSELSSSQWQALSEVVISPFPPRTTELSELLGLAQNSLSSVINALEKKKFIERERHSRDGRIILLRPCRNGVSANNVIEQRAAQELKSSLDLWGKGKVEKFTDILTHFVGESNPGLPPLLPGYGLVELATDEQRQQGRAFALRNIVEQGLEMNVPESLIRKESRNFLLNYQGQPEMVLEIDGSGMNRKIIFASWTSRLSRWVTAGAINHIDFLLGGEESQNLTSKITYTPLKTFFEQR